MMSNVQCLTSLRIEYGTTGLHRASNLYEVPNRADDPWNADVMSDKPTDPIVYGGQTHHWLSRLRFRRRESLAVSKTTGGHVVGSFSSSSHLLLLLLVGSRRWWRTPTPRPSRLQNSQENDGSVFLIFVADPTTRRLAQFVWGHWALANGGAKASKIRVFDRYNDVTGSSRVQKSPIPLRCNRSGQMDNGNYP